MMFKIVAVAEQNRLDAPWWNILKTGFLVKSLLMSSSVSITILALLRKVFLPGQIYTSLHQSYVDVKFWIKN